MNIKIKNKSTGIIKTFRSKSELLDFAKMKCIALEFGIDKHINKVKSTNNVNNITVYEILETLHDYKRLY